MLLNFQAVFRRYLRPEKDYLSFSLIYNYGKRSLDLVSYIDQVSLPRDFVVFSLVFIELTCILLFQICKDKVEAEFWITGLKALISSGQGGRSKVDGWSDGGLYFDVTLPT